MSIEIMPAGYRQDPLERLRLAFGGRPKGPSMRQSPSTHDRRWCMRHQKNCCMVHGKHKRGRMIRRRQLPGRKY